MFGHLNLGRKRGMKSPFGKFQTPDREPIEVPDPIPDPDPEPTPEPDPISVAETTSLSNDDTEITVNTLGRNSAPTVNNDNTDITVEAA